MRTFHPTAVDCRQKKRGKVCHAPEQREKRFYFTIIPQKKKAGRKRGRKGKACPRGGEVGSPASKRQKDKDLYITLRQGTLPPFPSGKKARSAQRDQKEKNGERKEVKGFVADCDERKNPTGKGVLQKKSAERLAPECEKTMEGSEEKAGRRASPPNIGDP